MEKLREITDHSVFTYSNEITVELRGQTAEGEFAAVTYQFEPTKTDTEQLQPRGSIDRTHEEIIREIVVEAGYELVA